MSGEKPDDRDEGVLSTSDLDIADSEYVAEIEEGRYVVSTDESAPDPTLAGNRTEPRSSLDPEADRYGIDIEVSINGSVSTYRTHSDDIVTAFSDLVRWYATQVGSDLDPSRVLAILVAESELAIGPRSTIETALGRHDLAPEDAIGDLLAALETHR